MTVEQATRWSLTLYISGASRRSMEAVDAVRRICDDDLAGLVDLDVIDALEHPELLERDHILALPTLVKHSPSPPRHLVGHLTDDVRIRSGLDLAPRAATHGVPPSSHPGESR